MTNNLLLDSLLEIGLTKFEAEVYFYLIKNEELNISKLAKEMEVYRVKIYTALEKLFQFGLIENQNDKIKPVPPVKVVALLKTKINQLSQKTEYLSQELPNLQKIYYKSRANPLIQIYEGKAQFLRLFHQIIEETPDNSYIYFINENQDFYNVIDFEYFYNQFGKPRIAKQITAKVLWPHNYRFDPKYEEFITKDVVEFRQSKFLPKSFLASGSTWITPFKVINWNTTFPRAVVIEDVLIQNLQKNVFETLWDGVKS